MAIMEVNRKKPYKVVIRVFNKQITKSFSRKLDAQIWERDQLHRRDNGSLSKVSSKPEPLTLNQLRDRFMREYARNRQAESTQTMESSLYLNYVAPFMGSTDIDQLKKIDFQNLMIHLSERRNLSNCQINRIRQILSCMCSQAVQWELIESNPLSGIRKLPEKDSAREQAIQYVTQDEAKKLLDWLEANDPWLYPKVRLLLNSGLRFGEMCALRVQDVVRGPNGFYLKVARTFCRYTKSTRNRTKGGRSRMLPLGAGMSLWLESLMRGKDPEAPLVWDSLEECKHQTKFHKHFRKALKGAQVRSIRVHDLRHTFAVHFLESGGHLYDLQKLLGHQSQRLTERYSHFSLAMSERARGLVDHGSSNQPVLTVYDGGVPNTMLPKRYPKQEIREKPTPESFEESKLTY